MALNEKRTLAIVAKLVDQFTQPLSKMQRAVATFRVGMRTALVGATAALSGVVLASTASFRALLQVAEGLDKIAKASDNLGITAESLTAIRSGAELAGVSMEQLGVAMRGFERVISEANAGSEKQRDLLESLGLQAQDFADGQLDVVDVLARVADGLGGVQSAADRTRILVELFGRSGAQLGALLNQGSAGIRKMEQDARAMGAVFSREELGRVEAFKDSWEALGQTFRTLVERLVVDLSPALTAFFNELRQAVSGNLDQVQRSLLAFAETIVNFLPILNRVAEGIVLVFEGFQGIANVISLGIGKAFLDKGVVDELQRQTDERAEHIRRVMALANETAAALDKLRKQIGEIRRQPGTLPPVEVAADPLKEAPAPDPTALQKFFAGFGEGVDKAIAKWQDFGKAGQEAATLIVDRGLDGLTDAFAAIIDGTKSAKQAFQDFARSLLSDLAKIIAKMLVMEGLQLVLGLEKGGVVPETEGLARGGVRRFAGGGLNRRGGIATRPTVLFGEGRNAEAFVPLPDNRSIPVTLTGGGGTTVNIQITAMDGRDVQRVLIEQQNTLRAIFENQVQTRTGMRRVIQRSA